LQRYENHADPRTSLPERVARRENWGDPRASLLERAARHWKGTGQLRNDEANGVGRAWIYFGELVGSEGAGDIENGGDDFEIGAGVDDVVRPRLIRLMRLTR
jgi:hypothetical protein